MNRRLTAANQAPSPTHLPALDGLRWLMVFSVACYHYWQHSWWAPRVQLAGITLKPDVWLRTGYIWVDGMLLLSGFLLFLPHAKSLVAGGHQPSFTGFYRRRFARIMPSYVLNLLVMLFFVALPQKRYSSFWQGAGDMLAHLTFIHPWFKATNLFTPLNGVLWTLGVEVQFYLIFPLVARAFWKKPLITYLGGALIAFGFRAYAMGQADAAMLVNQLPAFMDVYMNGFVAAWAYAWLQKNLADSRVLRGLISLMTLICLLIIWQVLRAQAFESGITALRIGQMKRRFPLSLLLSLVFLGTSLGTGAVRHLLGNRLAHFLAAISFQFYIWHQVVAMQMRRWGIPHSAGPNPQMTGDRAWQMAFVGSAMAISLILSILVTYLIERPLAKRLGTVQIKRRNHHA